MAFCASLPITRADKFNVSDAQTHRRPRFGMNANGDNKDAPLLVRAANGKPVERAPVWLLRQAGRYMKSFRAYSDVMPFRARSEDAKIVRTLSLQPWQEFGTDAVILFSDILTPLPSLGIDFDVISGKGPVIPTPIRTLDQAYDVLSKSDRFDPAASIPFVSEALGNLRGDISSSPDTALLGFVGAPFTLAAYSVEGGGSKHIENTKRMMLGDGNDGTLKVLLDGITEMVIKYAIYQLDSGAHAVQLFESWAHHLTPQQFKVAALPWIRRAIEGIKKERPDSTIMFFANGAGGKLEMMREELSHCTNVLAFDASIDMKDARRRIGADICLQGNVDPAILLTGDKESIRTAVKSCLLSATPGAHILNLGHGVVKETPEESVRTFVDAAKEFTYESLRSCPELNQVLLSSPVQPALL